MPLFKYYRPNSYFEKAIRYNELYFSANNELNDPHDLKASFFFEDDEQLWAALLSLQPDPDTWNLDYFLDTQDNGLISALNKLFAGVSFDSIAGSLYTEIENRSKALLKIFENNIKPGFVHPENKIFPDNYSDNQKAELCKIWLSALLARAVDHVFYSVSFTDSALNPMMWAHYADGFKGCVVIYNGSPQSSIGLRHNLLDNELIPFGFSKVNYIDGDKKIPVLECAIRGKAKAQEAILQKNAFWHYESEHRLLSAERSNPVFETINKSKKTSQRDRILHHQTNDILGVIFGPRCDERVKKKVDLTLLDNRRRSGNKPFYLLDTQLTLEGRVIISDAKKQCCPNIPGRPMLPEGMHQIIRPEELPRLLLELGIAQEGTSPP